MRLVQVESPCIPTNEDELVLAALDGLGTADVELDELEPAPYHGSDIIDREDVRSTHIIILWVRNHRGEEG